jgi:micrococcal nuclease
MMLANLIIAPDTLPANTLPAPVLKVCDGDGFHTKVTPLPGMELKAIMRFAYIDAPEMSQKGGPEAKQFLQALIGNKTVEIAMLHKPENGKCVDHYGRIVGVPYLREDKMAEPVPKLNLLRKVFGKRRILVRNIELEMVLNGWAWVLEQYGPDYRYLDAQNDARKYRRGIWAYDSNLSPWAFKKQERMGRKPDQRFQDEGYAAVARVAGSQCPRTRCGGKLTQRHGKNGKFLGCSNFPNCKVTFNQ